MLLTKQSCFIQFQRSSSNSKGHHPIPKVIIQFQRSSISREGTDYNLPNLSGIYQNPPETTMEKSFTSRWQHLEVMQEEKYMKYDVDENNKYNDLQCIYILYIYWLYIILNVYNCIYTDLYIYEFLQLSMLFHRFRGQATHCLKDHVPHLPSMKYTVYIGLVGGHIVIARSRYAGRNTKKNITIPVSSSGGDKQGAFSRWQRCQVWIKKYMHQFKYRAKQANACEVRPK